MIFAKVGDIGVKDVDGIRAVVAAGDVAVKAGVVGEVKDAVAADVAVATPAIPASHNPVVWDAELAALQRIVAAALVQHYRNAYALRAVRSVSFVRAGHVTIATGGGPGIVVDMEDTIKYILHFTHKNVLIFLCL